MHVNSYALNGSRSNCVRSYVLKLCFYHCSITFAVSYLSSSVRFLLAPCSNGKFLQEPWGKATYKDLTWHTAKKQKYPIPSCQINPKTPILYFRSENLCFALPSLRNPIHQDSNIWAQQSATLGVTLIYEQACFESSIFFFFFKSSLCLFFFFFPRK